MATSRFSFVSRARYTSPIPPLPRRAVISSEPSRVPTSTDMGISLKCNTALRGIMPTSDKGSKLNRGFNSSDHCAGFSWKAYAANDVLEERIGFDGIQEGIDLKKDKISRTLFVGPQHGLPPCFEVAHFQVN